MCDPLLLDAPNPAISSTYPSAPWVSFSLLSLSTNLRLYFSFSCLLLSLGLPFLSLCLCLRVLIGSLHLSLSIGSLRLSLSLIVTCLFLLSSLSLPPSSLFIPLTLFFLASKECSRPDPQKEMEGGCRASSGRPPDVGGPFQLRELGGGGQPNRGDNSFSAPSHPGCRRPEPC